MSATAPDLPSLLQFETLAPERADAAENRHAILRAAQGLLRKRPLQAITMTDLASAAGVGQGTLYRRFKNKAMLAKALLLEHLLALDSQLHRRSAAGATPRDLLHWFVGDLVELVSLQADLVAAITMKEDMLANWWTQTPPARWLARVMSILYESCTDEGEGETFASLVMPAVMGLGPASESSEVAAARARIARLVDALLEHR
ncbi:MAG: helix-turn-helix domain-containing protein [Pseudomonadota bacterium]